MILSYCTNVCFAKIAISVAIFCFFLAARRFPSRCLSHVHFAVWRALRAAMALLSSGIFSVRASAYVPATLRPSFYFARYRARHASRAQTHTHGHPKMNCPAVARLQTRNHDMNCAVLYCTTPPHVPTLPPRPSRKGAHRVDWRHGGRARRSPHEPSASAGGVQGCRGAEHGRPAHLGSTGGARQERLRDGERGRPPREKDAPGVKECDAERVMVSARVATTYLTSVCVCACFFSFLFM